MQIINIPHMTVLEGYGHKGEHIFKAATTCYKSEDKTKMCPPDFIRFLKDRGHTAMLEFMWIVLELPKRAVPDYIRKEMTIESLEADYAFINVRTTDSSYFICGNGRAFLNALLRPGSGHIKSLYPILKGINAGMFQLPDLEKEELFFQSWIGEIKVHTENQSYFPPEAIWHAYKLEAVSIGVRREIVRHRVLSFAEASTRYIDYGSFDFVFDSDVPEAHEIINEYLTSVTRCYKELTKLGFKRDDVRQVLPLGVAGEICVAGAQPGWDNFFALRRAKDAHHEIRHIANLLYEQQHKS